MPMPDEIVGLLRSKITFKWPDGHETIYPARFLRLACRCAMCVEETSGEALLDPATVPETIPGVPVKLELHLDASDVGLRDIVATMADGATGTLVPVPAYP